MFCLGLKTSFDAVSLRTVILPAMAIYPINGVSRHLFAKLYLTGSWSTTGRRGAAAVPSRTFVLTPHIPVTCRTAMMDGVITRVVECQKP